MYSDYSPSNAIILFGALQGLLLIFFLWKKEKRKSTAYWFFALFLFSLAYKNLWYGLYFMELFTFRNNIPYPYEFLIGIGFYFYIKSQSKTDLSTYKREIYWFIPAIVYFLLEIYFYVIHIKEGNGRIYKELDYSGFFYIVEYLAFIFNITLGILSVLFLNTLKKTNKLSPKESKNMNWLFLFSKVFIIYNITSLILVLFVSIPDRNHVITLYAFYLTFFINTIFIYWIGYIGYNKRSILFSTIGITSTDHSHERKDFIKENLIRVMEVDELFTQVDFSLSKLALATTISQKELSDYINIIHKCNVSEYINSYRVEKVKKIIDSSNFDHYTLEAISQKAGFKSKSSFNSVFKKHVGITPSRYKKRDE